MQASSLTGAKSSKPFDLDDWQGGNQALKEEFDATIHLQHHLPYGLHGSFSREVWL